MKSILKKGSLFYSGFPFNYYIRYIGKPTYKQGRKLGFSKYVALWFTPTFGVLLIEFIDIIRLKFNPVILMIVFLNTIYSFLFLMMHGINTDRRKMISEYRRLDRYLIDSHRRMKFELSNEIGENEELKKKFDNMDRIVEEIKNNPIKY